MTFNNPQWLFANILGLASSTISNHCKLNDHLDFREWTKSYDKGEWDFIVVGTSPRGYPQRSFFRVSDEGIKPPLNLYPKRIDDVNLSQQQFREILGCTPNQLYRKVSHDDHIGFRDWIKQFNLGNWDFQLTQETKRGRPVRLFFRVE